MNDLLIVKCFKGCLIKNGNRARGVHIYEEMMLYLQSRLPELNPNETLFQALSLIKPSVELSTKKRGGTSHKLPSPITEERGFKIAVHWLIREARDRSERTMAERLGAEVVATLKGYSLANVKKKEDIHRIALLNRAFLRYR